MTSPSFDSNDSSKLDGDGIASAFGDDWRGQTASADDVQDVDTLDSPPDGGDQPAKGKGDPKLLILAGVLAIAFVGVLGAGGYYQFKYKPDQAKAKQSAIMAESLREQPPAASMSPTAPAPIVDMFASSGSTSSSVISTDSAALVTAPATTTAAIAPPQPTAASMPSTATAAPVIVAKSIEQPVVASAPAKPSVNEARVEKAAPAKETKALSPSRAKTEPMTTVAAAEKNKKVQYKSNRNQAPKSLQAKSTKKKPSSAGQGGLDDREEFVRPAWAESARVLAFWPQTGADVQAWVSVGAGDSQRRIAVRSGDMLMGLRVQSVSAERGEVKLPGVVITLK